jgi:hypothetical protein
MSRSCQSATSSSAGTARPDDAREAAEVLAQDGVALVGHRARALLPAGEALLGLGDLGPLPVAHVRREPLDPRGDSASAEKSAACRSRATTCVATVSGCEAELAEGERLDRPARGARRSRRRRRSCRRRSRARREEPRAPALRLGEVPASTTPNVTGSAWMPWLRPIIGVALCSSARSARASRRLEARGADPSARTRSTARLVSSTSLDVIPRWSHRAGSPASSSTWVRNAMTSCFVVRSISSMRVRVELQFLARIEAAVPRDDPRASIASQAASSTSSHAA